MRKGSIVRFGWYYRRKPIHDIERPIGIIVEDAGYGEEYMEPLMKNYSIGYWNRGKFIYY